MLGKAEMLPLPCRVGAQIVPLARLKAVFLLNPGNPLVGGFWGDIQYVNAQARSPQAVATVPGGKVPPAAEGSFSSHFDVHSWKESGNARFGWGECIFHSWVS